MVAYSPTPASAPDMERGDLTSDPNLAPGPSKGPWRCSSWQLLALLLLLSLSLGGAFVLTWIWTRAAATVESSHKEALLQPTADRSDPHSALKRISSNSKAAIHLEGSYEESASSGLQWHSGQGQGFAQGGIQIQDNQILIPESGLYFVYSQASFRVSCQDGPKATPPHTQATPPHHGQDDDSPRRTPLSHRVLRFSESIAGEVSLMSAVRSACLGNRQLSEPEASQEAGHEVDHDVGHEAGHQAGQGWYNAIYLGAVFQLHKGDRLWTETNALSELETEDGKTFFGLFALF